MWRAIVIDEFQDTSAMQYRLLKMLASHNHITIVGDDDQVGFSFIYFSSTKVFCLCFVSINIFFVLNLNGYILFQSIFSFNGADISGFHSFRKDFPNFKEVCLVLEN